MSDETTQPGRSPADSNDEQAAPPPAPGTNGPETPPLEAGPLPAEGAQTAADLGAEAPSEVEALRRERDELRDRWLRAAAELENFRKRMRKEVEDVRLYAVADLIRDLLEVLDNFERATISMDEMGGGEGELENLKNGVKLIQQRFRGILMAQGLERIEAAGAEFDPALHEAILQIEKEGARPGEITEVVQPGYKLKDLVIRPCRVIVAR
jgi:molecular chaperone GrpE